MTIITVAKEGIGLQHQTLYQVLVIMPEFSLDKLYKKISKRTASEKSVAIASLPVNGRYYYSGMTSSTCGVDMSLQIMNRKGEDPQVHLGLIRAVIAVQLIIKLTSAQHHYSINEKRRLRVADLLRRRRATEKSVQFRASRRIIQSRNIIHDVERSSMMMMRTKKRLNP